MFCRNEKMEICDPKLWAGMGMGMCGIRIRQGEWFILYFWLGPNAVTWNTADPINT